MLKPEDEWVYSDVEPVVNEDLWDQCNLILDQRRAGGKKPAKRPVHLFAGVAFCSCGKKMYVPSNTPKYVCYGCRTKLPVPDLETIFQQQLKGFFFSDAEVAKYIEQADKTIHEKDSLLKTLETKHKKLKGDMDKLLRLYLDGGISKDGFSSQYQPLETQAKQLEDQIPQIQGEVDFLRIQYLSSGQILAEAKDLYSRWPDLQPNEKRQIVENTVEKIIIAKDDITIELGYLPSSNELMAERQRNFTGSSRRRA